MKKLKSIKLSAILFSCATMVVIGLGASTTKSQTVYVVCTWDTSSIYKQTDGKQKFERRFYVTELISLSKESFLGLTSGKHIEDSCGDYIEATVFKAAAERGERL